MKAFLKAFVSVMVLALVSTFFVTSKTYAAQNDSWFANLSARGWVENSSKGEKMIFVGYAAEGNNKPLLIRSVSQSITQFAPDFPYVQGTWFEIHRQNKVEIVGFATPYWYNAYWLTGASVDDNTKALMATFDKVGAFSLLMGQDVYESALVFQTESTFYSIQVRSYANGSGVDLAEIYDVNGDARLVNLSARLWNMETDAKSGFVGFVISGNSPMTVVIRGIGPELASYGVTTALEDPTLILFDNKGNSIAVNDNWQDGASITAKGLSTDGMVVYPASNALFDKVGAFRLAAGSKDSVIVARLNPGIYTSTVRSKKPGAIGEILFEVYKVPTSYQVPSP
jgi:hypothetical protein